MYTVQPIHMTLTKCMWMMKNCVHVQSLGGATCIGDWGRATLCKGLKVPRCFIPPIHVVVYLLFNVVLILNKLSN